jgi:hypothetical protein
MRKGSVLAPEVVCTWHRAEHRDIVAVIYDPLDMIEQKRALVVLQPCLTIEQSLVSTHLDMRASHGLRGPRRAAVANVLYDLSPEFFIVLHASWKIADLRHSVYG